VAVRARIDARLAENGAAASHLPTVADHVRGSDVGQFLLSLSASSSIERLDALIASFEAAKETIDDLKDQEARLRIADTTKARQQLTRQAEKLIALGSHIASLDAAMGSVALADIQQDLATVKTLEDAAALLARSFESEPLPGVGSSPWKALWDAAQRFSKERAYPNDDFPFLGNECRCVLCQQPMEAESRDRFGRFHEFVRNDTQVRLQDAKRAYEQKAKVLRELTVSPQAIANNLKDLEETNSDVVADVRTLLSAYEAASEHVRKALSHHREPSQIRIEHGTISNRLTEASNAAKAAAEDLGNPEGIQRQVAALAARRAELELLDQVKKSRAALLNEIARLTEREAL
jgi:hypothetical protein